MSRSPVTSASTFLSNAAATIHRSSGSRCGHVAGSAGRMTSAWRTRNEMAAPVRVADTPNFSTNTRSHSSSALSPTANSWPANTAFSTAAQTPRLGEAKAGAKILVSNMTFMYTQRGRCSPLGHSLCCSAPYLRRHLAPCCDSVNFSDFPAGRCECSGSTCRQRRCPARTRRPSSSLRRRCECPQTIGRVASLARSENQKGPCRGGPK